MQHRTLDRSTLRTDYSRSPTFKRGDCRTVVHQQRIWRYVQADLIRRTGLDKEETDIKSNRHLLVLNVKGSAERGECFIDGMRAEFVPRRPGDILFIPAGCYWKGWEVGAATAAYLSISIDPVFVTDIFSGITSSLPTLSPNLGCDDPIMVNAARGVGQEINDKSPLSPLLVESYIATIFAQLFRLQKYVPSACKGGLAAANLKRVIERIDTDLTASLSLAQLAALTGLSIPHFCRAFKQTLGCPPHAYIVRRRLARAKEYLRFSSMSITDVALLCGFSSSSHFANAFRRDTGTTPLEFRGSSLDKSFE